MNETITECITVLDKVLPVVVRVHGSNHPELPDIRTAFEELKEALFSKKDPSAAVQKIRTLTNNYTLPPDACQAYTRVYHALKTMDEIL